MSDPRKLALLADIPPELRCALESRYELVVPSHADTHLQVAVTTSVAGAGAADFARLPNLRLLACNGVGLDRIDLAAAKDAGVRVVNTPGVLTEDTADFAIGLIYAVCRRIVEADRFVRTGGWLKGRMPPSRRVGSLVVGIVGLGRIGSEVARRAAALGMAVLYTGRRAKPDAPYAYVPDLIDLATRVDVLVLTCPGGPDTEGVVNRDVLAALGRDGYLINIARASVVDEQALVDALENRAIKGAALDVFPDEPKVNERLLALENVVLQPHYAAVTSETRRDIARILRDAIDDFFDDRVSAPEDH